MAARDFCKSCPNGIISRVIVRKAAKEGDHDSYLQYSRADTCGPADLAVRGNGAYLQGRTGHIPAKRGISRTLCTREAAVFGGRHRSDGRIGGNALLSRRKVRADAAPARKERPSLSACLE